MRGYEQMTRGARFSADTLFALLVVGGLTLWTMFGASRGHLSGDHGVKMAQATALWNSHFSTRNLPENTALDPMGNFYPYGDLVRIHDGHHQGIYSVVFTALVAPAVGILGRRGIPIVPLLATWLTIFIALRVGRMMGLTALPLGGALAAMVWLTPIGFYAGQLQEHSVTVALLIAAIGCLFTSRPSWMGVLLGLAATMRPECYCALPAAGIALLLIERGHGNLRSALSSAAKFVITALLILVPYWLLNRHCSAVWDTVVDQNQAKAKLPWTSVLLLFGNDNLAHPLALCAITVGSVGVAWIGDVAHSRWLRAATFAASTSILMALSWWAFHAQVDERNISGLFSVTPLAFIALLRRPNTSLHVAASVFSLVFVSLVIYFDNSGTAGGMQFGARYLSPLLPIAMLFAFGNFARDVARSSSGGERMLYIVPFTCAIALTLWTSTVGWRHVEAIARDGERVAAIVSRPDAPVRVTSRVWESQLLDPISDAHPLMNMNGDPPLLLAQLASRGVNRLMLVTSGERRYRVGPSHRLAHPIERHIGWLEIQLLVIDP